ncbi:MAG: hypothetical protein ACJ74Z_15720 [Bryobacteraceae bacterium]
MSSDRAGNTESLPPALLARKPTLSGPLNRVALVLATLIILTSSFDIFLVFEVGGTFRFGQFLAPLLTIFATIRVVCAGYRSALGTLPLFIWLLVQLVFFPVTDFWPKSLGYCFWLLLDLSLLFSFVQLFSDNRDALTSLLRWYLYSFGFIAAFGIIQFLLPLGGLPTPLVVEWFVRDSIPRVNGFSYEPSYYASYLLIGFVLVAALRRSQIRPLSPRAMGAIYWAAAIAIVLSSSRMGVAFLLLDVISYPVNKVILGFKYPGRILFIPIRLKAVLPVAIFLCVIGTGIFAAQRIIGQNPEIVPILASGTGAYGTAAHSVLAREDSFANTLTVFAQHPFLGRSIGGVSSAIAELHGYTVTSFKDSKPFEGMSVFAEALAGSGLIGVIPFIVFLILTIYKPLKLAGSSSPFYSAWLRALVRALIFEWAVLQFNQNILRPYLWIHIAILATVYAAARSSSAARMSYTRT